MFTLGTVPRTHCLNLLDTARSVRVVLATILGLLVGAYLAACGGGATSAPSTAQTSSTARGASSTVTIAPETNTPGDIPDNTAYVPYSNAGGGYTFSHPEGWAQTAQGTSVTFTDKYNGASASVEPATSPLSVAGAQASEIPKLQASEPAFALSSVSAVTLPAGPGVLIVYRRNSPPDPVTSRSVRQEVHRFLVYGNSQVVAMDLFGAVGADNVDPYARMSQSLHFP
jgi:hypothetical protein